MASQIGYYDTLKSVAGKVFSYLASITLTGTDGKTITCTQDTSLDEAVAMSSKAPKASPTFTTQLTIKGVGATPSVYNTTASNGMSRLVSADNVFIDTGVLGAFPWSAWMQAGDAAGASYYPIALNPNGGNVVIGTTDLDGTPPIGRLTIKGSTNDGSTQVQVWRDSDEANVANLNTNGDFYAAGDVSALTFTDRTKGYEGDALTAISRMKTINGEIDHTTLDPFVQTTIRQTINVDGPEVFLAGAFETIDVEEDELVDVVTIDEKGNEKTEKKPIVIETKQVDEGFKIVDGQVVPDIVDEPVYKKITKSITRQREDVKFDKLTGKFFLRQTQVTETPGRDLGAQISVNVVALQQLIEENVAIKARLDKLEKVK